MVDLSAVPFVDSKGLEALVEVTEEMGKSGQVLRLCAANKTVREVLELTDLAEPVRPLRGREHGRQELPVNA